MPARSQIFAEGDECNALAFMLKGVVRVFKVSETGREITLYRFERGESCILTINCILGNRQFPAVAVAEENAEAVMVAAEAFRTWIDRYAFWRSYVFNLLSQRLAAVIEVVDEVAFRQMDARVAEWLLVHAGSSDQVKATHQAIAADLGTSREVVSRILQDFVADGMVETGRGFILLRNRDSLQRRAQVA
ncbi:MAG: Crp/Fnr family transcriptional regulator [Anaerolineae bacterium]|nr:Crp/Fnr family transcriptional regulator [Thermoflexales bacterium]MDW8394688.1 Crp/Fnr family transcriptional regulator [Anaerolineae bacterium]